MSLPQRAGQPGAYVNRKAFRLVKLIPLSPLDGMSTDEVPRVIIPAPAVDSEATAKDQGSQHYTALIRNLMKSSGVYALSSIASPLVSLVLAPFLTRSFSHPDYGALAVLNTFIALGVGVTQLGLSSAFFRAYNYDYEAPRDRLGIFSTVVLLLILASVPAACAVILFAPRLSTLLFATLAYSDPIRLAGLAILVQNLTVPGFAWLRATERSGLFSLLAIVNLFIVLTATLLLVGVFHMGIDGALLATGAGYLFVVACTLPVILYRAGLLFRFDIAHNLLSFGVPLVFQFVSYWVLQLSDRYLLSRLGSLSQTASYAVAYSLGGVLNVVILSPFILAWPTAMFAIAKREDAARVFQIIFRWFSLLLLLAAFAFSLVSTAALYLLFPLSYHTAASVIPLVTASLVFFGIYNIFAVGIGIRRKTWFTAAFTAIAALVNVGVNLALIPLWGSLGAALSTLIAYVLLALICYCANQRLYPIPFEIGKFGIALGIGLALYVGSSLLAQTRGIYTMGVIYLGALMLYAGGLVLLGRFSFPWRAFSPNR